MPAIVSSAEAEACLRHILEEEGHTLNSPRAHGETGVDVLAEKNGESWHIDVIAFKSSPPARAKDFYESFFRAVSRLNEAARHCVIALPARFAEGLPARAGRHRVAWERIGDAFPELEIWLIDTDKKIYRRTRWLEWLEGTRSRMDYRSTPRLKQPKRVAVKSAVTWTEEHGRRLLEARTRLRLSQKALGRAVGRTGARISELERCRISYRRPTAPSAELFERLLGFFGETGVRI